MKSQVSLKYTQIIHTCSCKKFTPGYIHVHVHVYNGKTFVHVKFYYAYELFLMNPKLQVVTVQACSQRFIGGVTYFTGQPFEGAKRPSGGRMLEGGVLLPHKGALQFLH